MVDKFKLILQGESMSKRKKLTVVVKHEELNFRKKIARPGVTFKNKKAYTRKSKYKKGCGDKINSLFFIFKPSFNFAA